MICDGVVLSPRDGRMTIPSADIEIDFDIENDSDNRVYMWGVRIRRGTDDATAQYLPDFIEWAPLDAHSERRLAQRFIDWLRTQCDAARAAGQTIAVFHWSHHEISRLRSVLGLAEVGDLIAPEADLFVDLRKVFEANFFSLHGSQLKKVAPIFGFGWNVEDPSGSGSQLYLSTVQNGDPVAAESAKQWLLSYNEDDTAATAAIRDGMRTWYD
jgi:predicted RecB family nuclease